MYFLSFLFSLLIAEFIIALYLFNNSYCGTLAKCDLILNMLPPALNEPICLPLNRCTSNVNIVNSSCVLGSDDNTVSKNNVYIGFIFAIILFAITVLATSIYYIGSDKYSHTTMNIIILTLIIIVFAFNMVTYDGCMSANCNLKILTDIASTDINIRSANMRCNEQNFKKSNINNFYISICVFISVFLISLPIYVYYNALSKSYSRFL
jgi:hypothetical protein